MFETIKTKLKELKTKLNDYVRIATCHNAIYGSLSLAYLGSGAHLIDKDVILFFTAAIYAVLAARH
ncbi:hypothetical protein [Falsiphaeobacter marinintestinus]|uniref:hypothetical protein n=1 Tax=Falsiphaeobacter marinintestinus TaxID=1492905 RepID=UPI0011B76401|nr:hypothetical protein [Phaeobacter marinintestinus]